MDQGDLCSQFAGITGTSSTEALNWLEMAGFELQSALDLFFNAAPGSNGQEGLPAGTSSRKHSFDDHYGFEEDEVRRPDEVKRQRLVETEQYLQNQQAKKITTAFTSGTRKAMTEKEKTLSQLFQAPTDIMTQTGFEEAKELARSENKWLLVNIQRDSEFQSHTLNRDFWSDESVKDMVRCSFVFWQKLDVTPEGETYIRYYKTTHFPHIAILDPRTGAVKWQNKPSPTIVPKLLAEKLQDFLGDNPSPADCRLPGPAGSRSAAVGAPSSVAARSGTASIANTSHSSSSSGGVSSGGAGSGAGSQGSATGAAAEGSLSEEDALKMAIALSLQQNPAENSSSASAAAETVAVTEAGAAATKSVFSFLPTAGQKERGFSVQQVLAADAPASAVNPTAPQLRAQIRLPNGSKVVEKCSSADSVLVLLRTIATVISTLDGSSSRGGGGRFEVDYSHPRLSLSEEVDKVVTTGASDATSGGAAEVTLQALGIVADTAFHVRML